MCYKTRSKADFMEAETIEKYKELYERSAGFGLVLKTDGEAFTFNVPKADGLIILKKLSDVENFVRGYELGYKSGL